MIKVFLAPDQRIRQRYVWFQENEHILNVTPACRRPRISREVHCR